MSKRKDAQPDVSGTESVKPGSNRPEKPDPDTLEGPGGRQESKGEQDALNKTTRRGER